MIRAPGVRSSLWVVGLSLLCTVSPAAAQVHPIDELVGLPTTSLPTPEASARVERVFLGHVLLGRHSDRALVMGIDTSRPLDDRADYIVHFKSARSIPESVEFQGPARIVVAGGRLSLEALDGTPRLLLSLRGYGSEMEDPSPGGTRLGDGVELVIASSLGGVPMRRLFEEAAGQNDLQSDKPGLRDEVRRLENPFFQKDPDPDGEGGRADQCSKVCKDGNGCEVTCPDGWCANCKCPASCTCERLEL